MYWPIISEIRQLIAAERKYREAKREFDHRIDGWWREFPFLAEWFRSRRDFGNCCKILGPERLFRILRRYSR